MKINLLGPPLFVLFLVLLVLKLVPKSDPVLEGLSWWWVTAPVWGTSALVLAFVIVMGLVAGVAKLLYRLITTPEERAYDKAMENLCKTLKRMDNK